MMSGCFVGDAQKYRPPEDVAAARKSDCIASFEKMLKKSKVLSNTALNKIKGKLEEEIDDAVEFARQSPLPDESELLNSLYA